MKIGLEDRGAGFVTKDSGERQTFASGMQRDSAQKDLRPDLVYGPMLIRWSELMGRGAAKYGERNWEKANSQAELDRMRASAFRHFVQWFYGMNPEEDHAAAVFFNISGAEYVKAKLAEASPVGRTSGTYETTVTIDGVKLDGLFDLTFSMNGGADIDEVPDDEPETRYGFKLGDRVRVEGESPAFAGRVGTLAAWIDNETEYPFAVALDGEEGSTAFAPHELDHE